jgi:2-dehydropantoate 2-reductase
MSQADKPVGVIGAGPVGSILAAHFAKIGHEVVMVEAAEERRTQLLENGLSIIGKDTIFSKNVKVLSSVEQLKDEDLQALFICTKTWTLKGLLPELVKVVKPETMLISFQNGIGPEDEIARFFPKEQVARGIVNYAGGVVKDTGAVSLQWFNPPNYLGPMDEAAIPRLEVLAKILDRAGLQTITSPESETRKLVFFKTILNSALNALCAASGITMRQAMTYRHTRNLARTLIREGLTVAAAVGYNYGENTMSICMKYLDAGGDHLPSMWTDLKRKCPTEIEYINGKIVKIGTMFRHCDVDANIFFTSAIVTQEIKSGVRDPDDIPDYLAHF